MTSRLTLPFNLRCLVVLFSFALVLGGCAGRRPVANVPAPPPVPPEPAPAPSAPSATGPQQPSTRTGPFVPGVFVEEGRASWYGVPFNGRRAASGEIFDMNSL